MSHDLLNRYRFGGAKHGGVFVGSPLASSSVSDLAQYRAAKMAAGSGAASAHGARSSSAALEASLDRRFQGVSNTMESIQGLSTWCIENKKHHGLIVRYWMKWLKKCKSLVAEFGS